MEGVTIGEVTSILETNQAILIVLECDNSEHWIAKSQIHDDSEVWAKGQCGDLVVTQWYAKQKGWE
jgi:hypothetical protein